MLPPSRIRGIIAAVKPKKIIYYNDPLNDDFAGTKIDHRPLPENFKYAHKDIFSRMLSFLLYWIIAIPLLWLPVKLIFGIRVKGKKNMKMVRRQGVFFYCNHTQIIDAMIVQLFVSGARRGYIVADQDATSIPGIRYLVQLLGCVPVPETPKEHKGFVECLKYRIAQKRAVIIYPEAHIWPCCTHIQPYGDASFVYPAELNAAVVPLCVTYRKRKFCKSGKPAMTIHIGKAIRPDKTLPLAEKRKKLRDKTYEFMLDMAAESENEEYIAYCKKEEENE